MLWDVPHIIAALSQLYELRAGDLIFTGTPAGVGALKLGDRIEGGIEGLEVLRHSIARAGDGLKAVRLYTYFRSSAAYRARIALHLKGLDYQALPVEPARPGERAAHARVPGAQSRGAGADAGGRRRSSSASRSRSSSTWRRRTPQPPLLPRAPLARAQVRALTLCDRLRHPPAEQPARAQLPARTARARGCGR